MKWVEGWAVSIYVRMLIMCLAKRVILTCKFIYCTIMPYSGISGVGTNILYCKAVPYPIRVFLSKTVFSDNNFLDS
jgi:hypothetical protein